MGGTNARINGRYNRDEVGIVPCFDCLREQIKDSLVDRVPDLRLARAIDVEASLSKRYVEQ